MITYFLGREEVSAYARDLVDERLCGKTPFPTVWFAIGISGQKIALAVAQRVPPKIRKTLKFIRTSCDRDHGAVAITFHDPLDRIDLKSATVLTIDSAVHTGKSMAALADRLKSLGAKNVLSYALILKRNARFVPNFFGAVIDGTDRAYFQLDKIPNNRLMDPRKASFGHIRMIDDQDYALPPIKCGVPSIEAVSFGDLIYQSKSHGAHVYLYMHNGEVRGYISFALDGKIVKIDIVVGDPNNPGSGVGGALMRWAETWARSIGCDAIELWAIEERISFYEERGFEKVPGAAPIIVSDKEKYTNLRKRILYNIQFN